MKNTTQLFLTGSNGIIGSYLYDELNKDYKVFTSKFRGEKTINFSTSVDFTDKIQLDTLVQEIKHFDVLIFLIGLAHKKGNIKEISSFDLINKRTLVNFLFYLEKYNKVPKKIIFASSISVYGENFGQTVYNEDSTKNPKSPYAKTKLSAENFLLDNYYGDVIFKQNTNDGDIIFQNDDGSGGIETYFYLDGGAGLNVSNNHNFFSDSFHFSKDSNTQVIVKPLPVPNSTKSPSKFFRGHLLDFIGSQ